jgi:hypothetical protein
LIVGRALRARYFLMKKPTAGRCAPRVAPGFARIILTTRQIISYSQSDEGAYGQTSGMRWRVLMALAAARPECLIRDV